MLEVTDLSFSYTDNTIIEDICFYSDTDKIISILGPNGVGKTTLLKCLCKLLKPQKGCVMVDNIDVLSLSLKEMAQRMSYVPQSIQPSRTLVFDAVLIGRRPHIDWGYTRKDIDIAWDVIRAMGMQDFALRYVDEISGGEFQKVNIARAIVQQPSVLILDEPTNNLDVTNQHLTMHLIADTVRDRKICTIMTMHDINLALHYSDELIFMKDTHIVKRGGKEIIDAELIKEVYNLDVDVITHENLPFVIPKKGKHAIRHLMHTHTNGSHRSQSTTEAAK
jgi:iron complex transport system ATP-binding protein